MLESIIRVASSARPPAGWPAMRADKPGAKGPAAHSRIEPGVVFGISSAMRILPGSLPRLVVWLLAGLSAGRIAASSTEEIQISVNAARARHVMAGGLGASWHAIERPLPVVGDRSHGGSAWGASPPAADASAWRQIYRHADWLGLDFVRVELEQRMFEPERGQFTWDSPEMRILYRILDWCQSRGADVFLQNMWGNVDWNAFPEFRGDAVQRLHSGPYSMDDFARSLAALAKHLIQTRHYSCIQWLCINNEPGYDWSWWQRPPNQPLALRPGLAAVRAALDCEGIRLRLSGPDWTDLPELKPEAIDFDEFIGAYDLHSYYANFDWRTEGGGYPLKIAEQRLAAWRQWSADRRKPLFLSELGTMVYGWRTNHPGPSTWPAAIKDAEFVVRALNLGVDGFNRWSFLNRGDLDGVWQMVDTWNAARGTYLNKITPRPNAYFVYGLISRLTAKHSTVVACDVAGGQIQGANRVFSAALESPRGELTWIVVNDAPQPWSTQLQLRDCDRKALYKYQVTPAHADLPDLRIAPTDRRPLADRGIEFSEMLPPMSLTIFSTRHLKSGERGAIEERAP